MDSEEFILSVRFRKNYRFDFCNQSNPEYLLAVRTFSNEPLISLSSRSESQLTKRLSTYSIYSYPLPRMIDTIPTQRSRFPVPTGRSLFANRMGLTIVESRGIDSLLDRKFGFLWKNFQKIAVTEGRTRSPIVLIGQDNKDEPKSDSHSYR